VKDTWLLDVNVLVAWLWPTHQAHAAAMGWMNQLGNDRWATCAVTEMGFLRLITNPSFAPTVPRWPDAVALLRKQTTAHANQLFWQDSLSLTQMPQSLGRRIQGPNQITDAYLLALAMQKSSKMVTFDYRMVSLAPAGTSEHGSLLILKP